MITEGTLSMLLFEIIKAIIYIFLTIIAIVIFACLFYIIYLNCIKKHGN